MYGQSSSRPLSAESWISELQIRPVEVALLEVNQLQACDDGQHLRGRLSADMAITEEASAQATLLRGRVANEFGAFPGRVV
jgi:hypothetical protein